MLIGTSEIDKFIRNLFPFERKVVPWCSHPVAILLNNHHQKSKLSQEAALIYKSQRPKHVEQLPILIRNTEQVVLEP